MAWWNPFKPKPKPSPGAGDSSRIETPGNSAPVRQGPQRPGEGFTSGGGSAPISGGNTVGGGSSGGGSGSTPETSVIIKPVGTGAEVIINGQGFSVLPGKITEFLTSRGISGSSFQSTLDRARQIDSDFNKQSTTERNILLTGSEAKKNAASFLPVLNKQSVPTLGEVSKTKYPTNFSPRGQVIADIRAGKYEGIIIKGGRIQYADGSGFVGVYGSNIYDVKTGMPITKKIPTKEIKDTPFSIATKQQPFLVSTALKNIEKANTITLLLDENNKATGIEYGGMSYDNKNFEKAFGVKLLYDPKKEEYFFGSASVMPDKRTLSIISGGFTPITQEELNNVQKSILRAKIKDVKMASYSAGLLGVADVLTNKKVSSYLTKESNWAYDKITSVTTEKLSKYAQIAEEQARQVLNESDFKTGNRKIDLTTKSLGYISYFGGSAGAYALNMISGLGNLALGLTLKPTTTLKGIILSSPAMVKSAGAEIYRTVKGTGDIKDFFGAALTLASIASTAASFSKYGSSLKNIKMTKQLKKELPAIKLAIKDSQKLLKTQQNYLQRVFTKSSNKWTTFGKSVQKMNGMNAKHGWMSITNGKKSIVIQKSVIESGKVRVTNFMSAQVQTSKISKFLLGMRDKYGRRFALGEYFYNNKKIGTYFAKTKARRNYTFIQTKGSNIVTAIDGRGAVSILRSRAEVFNFVKNAKFGKFSFTGKKFIGGNIDTVFPLKGKGFTSVSDKSVGFATGQKTRLGFSDTRGLTFVQKSLKADKGYKIIKKPIKKYESGIPRKFNNVDSGNIIERNIKNIKDTLESIKKDIKTPVSKTPKNLPSPVVTQKKIMLQKQLMLQKQQFLERQIKPSVVGSQLKTAYKQIVKVLDKNKVGLSKLSNSVKTLTMTQILKQSMKMNQKLLQKQVLLQKQLMKQESTQKQIMLQTQIVKQVLLQKQLMKQILLQKQVLLQKQLMKQQILRGVRTPRTRINFKFDFKPKIRIPIPSPDNNNKAIVKKILGNKLAPSYRIVIGSGKKVKTLGGRYSPKEAISKGAYVIDRTKERTVRIIPTKQKPNSQFKMNYLRQANRKFRNYRIQRGKRVKYSSTRLIEKRKYFNDLERLSRRRKK